MCKDKELDLFFLNILKKITECNFLKNASGLKPSIRWVESIAWRRRTKTF